MTAWTEHVKAFAKKHKIGYMCAISMPECSASYKGKSTQPKPKGKSTPVDDEAAIRQMIEDAKSGSSKVAMIDAILKYEAEGKKPQAKAEEMVDMPYKPKMTREMRFQMEKALREATKHLPPLRTKREDELIAQQVPALKHILKGLKEKTTGLKRQDMIDLILKREGLVKGALLEPSDYKQLEEQYKIRRDSSFLLDGLTLTNVRVLLSKLRDDLKKEQEAGERRKVVNTKTDIDRYTEELKRLERLSKMDQYLIKKYNEMKK